MTDKNPRYRYLTKSYVEWLGLKTEPLLDSHAYASWVSEDAVKPEGARLRTGVRFEGHLYLATEDGLAFDLVER